MDNAIVGFPNLDRFGLTFDRNRDHRLRRISIAELVGQRFSANELSATDRYDGVGLVMVGPGRRILCSVLGGAAGKI
jgi:hypothetical protein